MQTLEFERQPLGVVALDFCFSCQLIWFDSYESQQLTPGGVLQVFKTLSERRAPTRSPLPSFLSCPRCQVRLSLTHDLQHTTRFTYFRCEFGHGHLTPFFKFFLEKSSVRPATVPELPPPKPKWRTINSPTCAARSDPDHAAAARTGGPPTRIPI